MEINVFETKQEMGKASAEKVANAIKKAINTQGYANIILATGSSQFEMLEHLVMYDEIDWSCVTMFHLDEYIGIDISHHASFRKYLKERFVDQVSSLKAFHMINGDTGDPDRECRRVGDLIRENEIDIACIGIGENGHLAFNDPPADFETDSPYIVVDLDQKCREQQMDEGWFASLDVVPKKAISMGIKQIMKSRQIVVTVPDERKADAVRMTLKQKISPNYPASILRNHSNCSLFMDKAAASKI